MFFPEPRKRMPLQQNSALNVLQTLKELEKEIRVLRLTVENSIKRSERRFMFGANCYVEFDLAKVQDQIPKEYQGLKDLNGGHVVAVDYRTEKVTVNCGSILHCHNGKEDMFEFELSIDDVYVPKDYESEDEDSDRFDLNSD